MAGQHIMNGVLQKKEKILLILSDMSKIPNTHSHPQEPIELYFTLYSPKVQTLLLLQKNIGPRMCLSRFQYPKANLNFPMHSHRMEMVSTIFTKLKMVFRVLQISMLIYTTVGDSCFTNGQIRLKDGMVNIKDKM